MEHVYRIEGGHPIIGEITCLGAKNFATKAMIAALLADSPSTFTNVPPIGDVDITADMLASIGVKIQYDRQRRTMALDPTAVVSSAIQEPDSGSNRMPILLLGTLLNRFDEVSVPVLGGCRIGARKVDFHLDAIQKFGAEIIQNQHGFIAKKTGPLQGTHVQLEYPSVGATETCLLLSVMAEGTSIISNVAVEPEIMELVTMLRGMGAVIYTNSAREFCIEGVSRLHGTFMNILGDRIEATSWACLAAASDGNITVRGIQPEILGNFLSSFRQAGGGFEIVGEQALRFYRAGEPKPIHVETDVYPGFSTDWQQPFVIFLTQADGVSVFHETVYEKRFGYLKALRKLGAKVQLVTHCLGSLPCRFKSYNHEHSAIISGQTPLIAIDEPIEIPDLRAGLAYIIAAALAKGVSILKGIPMVERGYGDIVPRLQSMNLSIEKSHQSGV